jgi:hypothetical protein
MQVLFVELINNIYFGFLLCYVGLDVFFVLGGVWLSNEACVTLDRVFFSIGV